MSLVLQACVINRRNSIWIRWATSASLPEACKEKLEALSGKVLIDSYYTTPHSATWTAGRKGLAIYAETADLCQG